MQRSSDLNTQFTKEAILFTQYLIGEKPDELTISLYKQATKIKKIHLAENERRVNLFLLSHPWSIPFVDAGLAFTTRDSGIRKKVLLMSAILESNPKYASYFLSKDESTFYVFWILFVIVRSLSKTLIGLILLKRL